MTLQLYAVCGFCHGNHAAWSQSAFVRSKLWKEQRLVWRWLWIMSSPVALKSSGDALTWPGPSWAERVSRWPPFGKGDYPVQVVLKDNHFGLQHPDDVGNATVSGVIPSVNAAASDCRCQTGLEWRGWLSAAMSGTISVFADVQWIEFELRWLIHSAQSDHSSAWRRNLPNPADSGRAMRKRPSSTMPGYFHLVILPFFFHLKDIRLIHAYHVRCCFLAFRCGIGRLRRESGRAWQVLWGIISLDGEPIVKWNHHGRLCRRVANEIPSELQTCGPASAPASNETDFPYQCSRFYGRCSWMVIQNSHGGPMGAVTFSNDCFQRSLSLPRYRRLLDDFPYRR